MADVVLCCCCGGYEASKPNGLCEYCAVMCFSPRSVDGCRIVASLRKAESSRVLVAKGFPCSLLLDVICPYKRCECVRILPQCFKCRHYARFMREMDEEDERVMDEIEEIRRTGAWK